MKKSCLVILFFLSALDFLGAQGYEIKIKFTPYKNQYVYLGHYFGKTFPVVDSVKLDGNSEGVFKGNKPLLGGIYLIGFPGRSGFFEMLIDKQQKFSIIADSATVHTGGLKFINSPDNDLYLKYQKELNPMGAQLNSLQQQFKAARGKDSIDLVEKINKLDREILEFRKELIEKNPGAFLGTLLVAMQEPKAPDHLKNLKTRADSANWFYYYKSHYWDGVNFYDGRLAYTPFLDSKIDKYFNDIVALDPDSIIKEIDLILGPASASDEMTRFLLIKFANRYYTQKYMFEDKVFVHLFDRYFNARQYAWLDKQALKAVSDRAYSLMANIMGTPGSDIELPDLTGKTQTLYRVQAPYTVLAFWDPTCGHCKEVLPKLDSFYRAKWKAQGIRIYAVAKETDGTKKDWTSVINDLKLEGWTHVYYSKQDDDARINSNVPGYSQLYDVRTFPTLYLLDDTKKIIAKKLTYQQIEEVLKHKMK